MRIKDHHHHHPHHPKKDVIKKKTQKKEDNGLSGSSGSSGSSGHHLRNYEAGHTYGGLKSYDVFKEKKYPAISTYVLRTLYI